MNCHPAARIFAYLSLFLVLTLAACTASGNLALIPASPTPTSPPTPTLTPIPLAVSVNTDGIPIPEFNAELARYQQAQIALGNAVNQETATQAVRDEFVDNLLLAQAAAAKGYKVDDTALQNRIDSLDSRLGGPASWRPGKRPMDIRTKISGRLYASRWLLPSCVTRLPPPSLPLLIRYT